MNLNLLTYTVLTSILVLPGCSSDEPVPVNEEEVITTMTLTMVPRGGGTAVILQTRDLDGGGPNPPVVTVSSEFTANTSYMGTIELLNETQSPPLDVTEEVQEEGDEHQFFFEIGGSVALSITYSDQDTDGNPIGLSFTLNSGIASTGNVTVILRHEPDKTATGVSAGDISNAGGNTDINQTFPVFVK